MYFIPQNWVEATLVALSEGCWSRWSSSGLEPPDGGFDKQAFSLTANQLIDFEDDGIVPNITLNRRKIADFHFWQSVVTFDNGFFGSDDLHEAFLDCGVADYYDCYNCKLSEVSWPDDPDVPVLMKHLQSQRDAEVVQYGAGNVDVTYWKEQ